MNNTDKNNKTTVNSEFALLDYLADKEVADFKIYSDGVFALKFSDSRQWYLFDKDGEPFKNTNFMTDIEYYPKTGFYKYLDHESDALWTLCDNNGNPVKNAENVDKIKYYQETGFFRIKYNVKLSWYWEELQTLYDNNANPVRHAKKVNQIEYYPETGNFKVQKNLGGKWVDYTNVKKDKIEVGQKETPAKKSDEMIERDPSDFFFTDKSANVMNYSLCEINGHKIQIQHNKVKIRQSGNMIGIILDSLFFKLNTEEKYEIRLNAFSNYVRAKYKGITKNEERYFEHYAALLKALDPKAQKEMKEKQLQADEARQRAEQNAKEIRDAAAKAAATIEQQEAIERRKNITDMIIKIGLGNGKGEK